MTYGNRGSVYLLALPPDSLEIDARLGVLFSVTLPVGNPVIRDEDIGPDHLSAFSSQAVHEKGISFSIDIRHNTKNPLFRINGPYGAVRGDPYLGEIVADKV